MVEGKNPFDGESIIRAGFLSGAVSKTTW